MQTNTHSHVDGHITACNISAPNQSHPGHYAMFWAGLTAVHVELGGAYWFNSEPWRRVQTPTGFTGTFLHLNTHLGLVLPHTGALVSCLLVEFTHWWSAAIVLFSNISLLIGTVVVGTYLELCLKWCKPGCL
jgi:hypothetical protein